MWCEKCGTELKDGAVFCSKCGARQSSAGGGVQRASQAEQMQPSSRLTQPSQKKPGLSGGMIAGIAAAGIAVVALIAGMMAFFFRGKEDTIAGEGADVEQTLSMETAAEKVQEEEELPEDPLYYIADVAVIDTTVLNYTPGTKQAGMEWDNSLFYWLEDADTLSPEDGNIARCRLTKTLLRDARTGELIQYEIYSDPDSGAVYKIVSVEGTEGGLKLTDWYYLDGQPNFVFQREDSVYTPTYATIDKVGERYYFNNDVMVKWRMIRVPQEVGEYTLAPSDTWYSQGDYFAEGEELRQIYDDTELRMLNAAHNTYDAVLNGGNIGRVQGYVRDTTGSGIAGKEIKIYRAEDNVLLYETVTEDSGLFSLFVYLDETACYLKVEGDGQYKETEIQGINLLPASLTYACDMTLHKESGDEYPVTLRVYPAADIRDDGEGNTAGDPVQTASAVIREGAGNYKGDILRTVETQNGELTTNLPSGVYTVQVQTDGYPDAYREIEVWEEAAACDVYVMPGLAQAQTGIFLTWEGEADLDLTLFTPWQAAEGDMAHIGGSVSGDDHGNLLVADNKRRCELMYVNTAEVGSYKLYVNNYTDSLAGNYASDLLSGLHVRIYLYNSDGFVAEYTIPLGQKGVVWEVAEINGKNVTPAQRVYAEITGKKWWTEDKEKAVVRTKTAMTEDSEGTVTRTEYEEYDKEGKIVLRESYEGTERNGELQWRTLYVYDEEGKLTMETSYQGDGTPSDKTEYEYTYATDGTVECMLTYFNWSEDAWNAYGGAEKRYDEKGRLVYEHTGMHMGEDWYLYGETEQYIDALFATILASNGMDSYVKIYDEDGKLQREEYSDATGSWGVAAMYSYDDSDKLIQMEDYRGDHFITEYVYNIDGQLEKTYRRWAEREELYSINAYYYDEHGYLAREEHAGRDYWYAINYDYDERGRCVGEEKGYIYNDVGTLFGLIVGTSLNLSDAEEEIRTRMANEEIYQGIRRTQYTYY